jgi:nitrogen fixation/metabolism regulation signal transduction histidine kinase
MTHSGFDAILPKLAGDPNARVRQAAEVALLRRRQLSSSSALGRQHEQQINTTLDDIEARFGVRGRAAVKRAADQIANTFARELYHEIVGILTPLALSADRIATSLGDEQVPRADLAVDAGRMRQRIARLRAVLDGMRAFAEQPKLEFATENLKEIVEESVANVRDAARNGPPVRVEVGLEIRAAVCRPRLVQALRNVLANAMESYAGVVASEPILVTGYAEQERVVIEIQDHGCGMSEQTLADAVVLFVTSKETGTGFGLPLAIKIVESEHDGRLTLESNKGHGTKVTIVVPARRQREGSL